MQQFNELRLKPRLLDALQRINFTTMTEVQQQAIPALLEHRDLIVRSKTGSGKTAAFLIPIFELLEHKGYPQAIIMVPTRELAVQVNGLAAKLGESTNLRTALVYGGASINIQIKQISGGADVIIGTPGRILDLIERRELRLERIKILVLDEADMMLDMGFIDDVELIISNAPKERQTALLSATMPREILGIARRHMKPDATKLTVGEEEEITVSTISHTYYVASGKPKFSALLAYIDRFKPEKCIIFTATQRESEFVHRFLHNNGFDVIVMHGGMTQAMRERSLRAFEQHARFLIATNLAARGLDIPNISDIINFDAPDDPKTYVHRVGRSARMGKHGRAFTIFARDQRDLMHQTMRYANITMQQAELDTNKFADIELPLQQHRQHGRFNRGPPRHSGSDQQGRRQHGRPRGAWPQQRHGFRRRGYSSERG